MKSRKRKRWTMEENWELCELYNEMLPWELIANELDRTVAACRTRLSIIRLAFEIAEASLQSNPMEFISAHRHTTGETTCLQ